MTVRRQDSEEFDASPEQVLASIFRILKRGQQKYSYVDTEVNSDSGEVHTRIKPNWWPLFLSSRLHIQVEGGDTASSVVVRTRSQWFILGDFFDFYHSYIRDLLSSLRSEMERNVPRKIFFRYCFHYFFFQTFS